jgi:hypothetical protein
MHARKKLLKKRGKNLLVKKLISLKELVKDLKKKDSLQERQ